MFGMFKYTGKPVRNLESKVPCGKYPKWDSNPHSEETGFESVASANFAIRA